jgi:hypothetical protein
MRKTLAIAAFLVCLLPVQAQTSTGRQSGQNTVDWQARLHQAMPLLGHRNWILIVDSAYPLQTSPGVETIETGGDQLVVTRAVLEQIRVSIHVRPIVFLDAELPFVPDADAPGATSYRAALSTLLKGVPVEYEPHDKIITDIDKAGKTFHILVLKTKLAIPYTSVFIRLDCNYWSADAEKRLREKMSATK